jgi:hypothetical protein
MNLLYWVALLIFNLNAMAAVQENATWIKSNFFRGFDPVSKKRLVLKDIEVLASKLKKNHIRYAYIFSGPFENDGHLPSYAYSKQAKASIATLKKLYPELKILPWIGGVQNKTVHLEMDKWTKNAVNDIKKLVKNISVDGVHLDFEYVLFPVTKYNPKKLDETKYGRHWVRFHKNLREAIPNEFLSSVVVSTATGTKPWKHKHSLSETKEVSSSVNQISFMFYETNIHESKAYRENIKEQLLQIINLKNELNQKAPQYLFAVGTFSGEKALSNYRDLRFENLPTTLNHLKELSAEISPKKPIIDGLAVYCEWETTDQEWDELRSFQ